VLELMSRPVPTAGAKVQRGRPKNRNRPGPKYELIDLLAGATGLEPAASGVTGRRSNQLSYAPAGNGADLRRTPGQVKDRAGLVGGDGLEPPTSCV
jgi:hypothetical protein